MIVWLNGPFGAGKTTAGRALVGRLPEARLFDTETIGTLLRPVLADRVVDDFQEWPSWRRLVVATLVELDAEVGGTIVVPQTVVIRSFWDEIAGGLDAAGVALRACTLDVGRAEHARRIDADVHEPTARAWRHSRRSDYDLALRWLRSTTETIDTSALSRAQVVDALVELLG